MSLGSGYQCPKLSINVTVLSPVCSSVPRCSLVSLRGVPQVPLKSLCVLLLPCWGVPGDWQTCSARVAFKWHLSSSSIFPLWVQAANSSLCHCTIRPDPLGLCHAPALPYTSRCIKQLVKTSWYKISQKITQEPGYQKRWNVGSQNMKEKKSRVFCAYEICLPFQKKKKF